MLNFYFQNQALEYDKNSIAEPDGGVSFAYDDVWAALPNITAVFSRRDGAEQYIVPVHRGKCFIPYELLLREKSFTLTLKSGDTVTNSVTVPAASTFYDRHKFTVPELEKLRKRTAENSDNIEWLEDNMPKDTVGKTEFDETVDEIKTELAETAEEIKQGNFEGKTLTAKSLITENSIQAPELKRTFETENATLTASIRQTQNAIGLKYTSEDPTCTQQSELTVTPAKITLKADDEVNLGGASTPKVNVDSTQTFKAAVNDADRILASSEEIQLAAPSVKIKASTGGREIADFQQDNLEIRTFDFSNNVLSRVSMDDDFTLNSNNISIISQDKLYIKSASNGFTINDRGVILNIPQASSDLDVYIVSTPLYELFKQIFTLLNYKT